MRTTPCSFFSEPGPQQKICGECFTKLGTSNLEERLGTARSGQFARPKIILLRYAEKLQPFRSKRIVSDSFYFPEIYHFREAGEVSMNGTAAQCRMTSGHAERRRMVGGCLTSSFQLLSRQRALESSGEPLAAFHPRERASLSISQIGAQPDEQTFQFPG